MEKKEQYKNNTIKEFDSLAEYFPYVIEFSKNKKLVDKIIENIDEHKNNLSRVWLLFASNDERKWDCVQVGQSKYDVAVEIKVAISNILNEAYLSSDDEYNKNSVFYKNACPAVTSECYNKYLYGKIGKEYNFFRFCLLDVDRYLGIATPKKDEVNIKEINENDDVKNIVTICKNQYAEAKIAYETLAIYWRLVSSGIDGQTIAHLVDNDKEMNENTKKH